VQEQRCVLSTWNVGTCSDRIKCTAYAWLLCGLSTVASITCNYWPQCPIISADLRRQAPSLPEIVVSSRRRASNWSRSTAVIRHRCVGSSQRHCHDDQSWRNGQLLLAWLDDQSLDLILLGRSVPLMSSFNLSSPRARLWRSIRRYFAVVKRSSYLHVYLD